MTDIYLDLHGVCLDFTTAALRAHGWAPHAIENLYANWPKDFYWLHQVMGISHDAFLAPLDANFWATIPSYSWTQRLIVGLKKLGAVTYCTSPGTSPECAAGALMWLRANGAGTNFVLTSQKYRLAHPKALLIDDSRAMYSEFDQCGGTAFLVPQPWNGGKLCTERDVDDLLQAVQMHLL